MRVGAFVVTSLLLLTHPAGAQIPPAAHAQYDGIDVTAYSLHDKFLLCFKAKENVKIAAEYGIEFKIPPSQAGLWDERFPKLISKPQNYFDLPLPVLLKSVGAAKRRNLILNLGICINSKYCEPITISLTIIQQTEPLNSSACDS